MSVHPFPVVSARPPLSQGAPARRPDRVELMLVAGLVLATATQFALCVWYWLA